MVIEEALTGYLLNYSGLSSLVSNRIHYLKLPQKPVLPAVVMQVIDSPKIHGFTADVGAMTRIQVTTWSTSYSVCSEVKEQIRAATQNYLNQNMSSSVPVKNIEYDDGPDMYEDETGRYGKVTDLIIWHTEA
jgi:hypothetical protein